MLLSFQVSAAGKAHTAGLQVIVTYSKINLLHYFWGICCLYHQEDLYY